MNNDSSAIRGRHLESLANMFIGKFTSVDSIVAGLLEELEPFTGASSIRGGTDGLVPAPAAGDEVKFLCGDGTWSTVASGSCILDTVCPSVNGGLWYEVANGTPVVKIYYGGNEYPLGSGALEPTLTVAPSPLTVPAGSSASATISCDSGGNYLVTSLTEGVTAELVDNVITVAHVLGIEEASVKIRVMASSGFNAAEILLPVAMAKASPNLTVTPSANTVPCAGSITAEVSYSGGGTISVSGDTVTPTYDANTQTITVPYNGHETSATITVNLTASTGYLAATQSFTVAMEEPRTILTATPTATATKEKTITVPISCNSGGTISISTSSYDQTTLGWTWDGETLTIPFYLFSQDTDVIYTISVAANDIYPAASTTFRITYFGGSVAELEKLVVAMPFNDSPTEDICGNTWTATGTPQVTNGTIYFDGSSYLTKNESILLGGQDFTVCGWCKFDFSRSDGYASIFRTITADKKGVGVLRYSSRNEIYASLWVSGTIFVAPGNDWFHFELVCQYSESKTKFFINGKLEGTISDVRAREEQTLCIGREEKNKTCMYLNDFKVYDGVALHTADFTPPARSS